MTEYCIGTPGDMPDIIDFLNMVFSQNSAPHNFKQLLPKVYSDAVDTSSFHHLLKENGKIKAVVCLYPVDMMVGGKVLKIGHIGSVSVHGYSRGKGYMKLLMNNVIKHSRDKGYDALVLGGLKNRYQHFGFQPSEIVLHYTFIRENIRHALNMVSTDGIRFEKVDSPAHPALMAMRMLHTEQPAFSKRGTDENFLLTLQSWHSEVFSIVKNDRFIGYCSTNTAGTCFNEILLKNTADFPSVLKAWFDFRNISALSTSCAAYEQEKNELFGKYCENYSMGTGHSWNILNFRNVAEAYLSLKSECVTLKPGDLTISIAPFENLLPGESCRLTYGMPPSETNDQMQWNHLDATEGMFSLLALSRNYGHSEGIQYKNWFPLPLYVSGLDAC